MTETNDSKALRKIVDSLVDSRYSPQRINFNVDDEEEEEDSEFIKIPFPTDDNKTPEQIALYIQKSQKELPGNPIVLFTHGDGEDLASYISYEEYFCPFGVSFCVMDYRGTGYSDGDINTSGVNETKDVIEVIKYLKSRGFEKISYFGRSLGAKCGIYGAAQFPDLVCLAFDSGSIDTKTLSIYQLNYFKKIEKNTIERLWPEACRIINEKYGIDFLTLEEPYMVADKITQPIFVIHGNNDKIVPISNSEKLMELVKSQDKKFVPFNGGHNDFARYHYFIQQFIFILHHNGVDVTEKDFNN